MRTRRHPTRAMALHRSGRGQAYAAEPNASLLGDLRLFALTFAGGFLFLTVYLA